MLVREIVEVHPATFLNFTNISGFPLNFVVKIDLVVRLGAEGLDADLGHDVKVRFRDVVWPFFHLVLCHDSDLALFWGRAVWRLRRFVDVEVGLYSTCGEARAVEQEGAEIIERLSLHVLRIL